MGDKVLTVDEAVKKYAGKYSKKLVVDMMQSLDILGPDIVVIRNLSEPLVLPKVSIDPGARPYNSNNRAPKGGRKLSGRELTPRTAMKIIDVIPEDYRDTFLNAKLAPNAKVEPFAKEFWAAEMAKIGEEINDSFYENQDSKDVVAFEATKVYQAGERMLFTVGEHEIVFEALATTTAGDTPVSAEAKWIDADAIANFDGPKKVIADEISSGKLVPIATGVIDSSNAMAKHKSIWRSVDNKIRKHGMVMMVSQTDFEAYIDNFNDTIASGTSKADYEENGEGIYLRGSNKKCIIRPYSWMDNTRRIILTTKNNFYVGMNQVSDKMKVGKVVPHVHGYTSKVQWMLSFNFADIDAVFVNDQD